MTLFDTLKFIADHPLNREHKFRAIIRFVKWQIGSRLVPGAIFFDWINGSKFLVKHGEQGLTGNIYNGLNEFPDMGFLLHFLRNEDLFVDIGANIGAYTILACSVIGARGIAFEPVPDTYERLVENIRLNQLDETVRCINKGVSSQQETIAFTGDIGTKNHALAPGERYNDKITVTVTPLDTALQGSFPSLIKIDVEGYEFRVLEGAQEVLSSPSLHVVIIELNRSGDRYDFDESKILDLMFQYGFKTYSYNPFDRTLTNLEGKNPGWRNTLFIRDKPMVEERLRTSPKITIRDKLI